MAEQNLQWGVIGTGAIANDFATALARSERCRIVNVTSFPGLAQPFAAKFGVARATDDLTELLNDREVQAVYVATPHPLRSKSPCPPRLRLRLASSRRRVSKASS